jgi:aminomethyltransferase
MSLKKTPFYEMHKLWQGNIVDFHGWELPVNFRGILEEHNTVRQGVGLFDVSHMGEILVTGPSALAFVQKLITNNAEKLAEFQICYTPMCYENGTIVDDCLVYKYNTEKFLIVVNASNIEKDFEWMQQTGRNFEDLKIINLSDSYGQLALQGPYAEKCLKKIACASNAENSVENLIENIKYYYFSEDFSIEGIRVLLSRTGYTGEDGFEIYIPEIDIKKAEKIWKAIMDAGKEYNIEPIGLGARDTLRLEARLMLYGNDIDNTTTPVEAGLGWTVKLKKPEFNGYNIIMDQKKNSSFTRKLVGFEMTKKAVPRHGYEILDNQGNIIGAVTSGSFAPYIKKYIGLGYVKKEFSQIGTPIFIQIRKKRAQALVVKTPFYSKSE